MTRYIDLCVELKKGREAKDGLIHYRNVCQHVNVSSLEEVIKYFLKTATDRAQEAQSKADLVGLAQCTTRIHDQCIKAWTMNSNLPDTKCQPSDKLKWVDAALLQPSDLRRWPICRL